jgi:methanogenic corrinoid protein MtbC1
MADAPLQRKLYTELILRGDFAGARAQIDRLVARQGRPSWVLTQVLAPAQEQIGELWEANQIGIAQEHRASSVTEACLDHLVVTNRVAANAGRVLLTVAEGEYHTLPARMVAQVWRAAGWHVVAITPSLPAVELAEIAARDPSIVAGVSCSVDAHLIGAWRSISVLREAGMRVVVGGRAFDRRPHLAFELGADAYCGDPVDALTILQQWTGDERHPRESVTPPGWVAVEPLVRDARRFSLDAWQLAQVLSPQPLASTGQQAMDGLVMTALASAAVNDSELLRDHLQWRRGQLDAHGVSPQVMEVLVEALSRVLPGAGGHVRWALAAAHR